MGIIQQQQQQQQLMMQQMQQMQAQNANLFSMLKGMKQADNTMPDMSNLNIKK